MAEVKGEVAVRDSGEVMSEIERTRQSLASTIDALTERVSPGNVARQGLDRAREQVSRPPVRMAAGAVALVTVAVVAFALWRRHK